MDATAYLTRQGWLGAGHSLQPGGRGIKKPLLVSKKRNVLGLGKKLHDSHADQWWARTFDSSLKSLAVDKDQPTGTHHVTVGGSGALEMVQKGGVKGVGKAGLYGNFVRGEGLSGTLTPEGRGEEPITAPDGELTGEKRKLQEAGDGDWDGAVLSKKRKKNPEGVDVQSGIVDVGEVWDKITDPIPVSRLSKEDRRRRRKAVREAAKHGGVQSATAAGDITEATRTQKRRKKGEVVEIQPVSSLGHSRAAIDVREDTEGADPPVISLPNTALERTEKRRKGERAACKLQVQA